MDEDQERREAMRNFAVAYQAVRAGEGQAIRKAKRYVYLKAAYMFTVGIGVWLLAIRLPDWAGVPLKVALLAWTAWIVWAVRARPCVICGRKTRTPVASLSYVPLKFIDISPIPQHMLVYVCRQHRDLLQLQHMLQQKPDAGN